MSDLRVTLNVSTDAPSASGAFDEVACLVAFLMPPLTEAPLGAECTAVEPNSINSTTGTIMVAALTHIALA